MKTGEIMFRKTFCPDKPLCFLAGKFDSTMLRGWLRGVPYLLRFATIRDYSHYSYYSRLFAIRYSGFPDTPIKLVKWVTLGRCFFSLTRFGCYPALVFTKSVDSNFRAFWLAPVTWNILGYSLFSERREKWLVVWQKFQKKKLWPLMKRNFFNHLFWQILKQLLPAPHAPLFTSPSGDSCILYKEWIMMRGTKTLSLAQRTKAIEGDLAFTRWPWSIVLNEKKAETNEKKASKKEVIVVDDKEILPRKNERISTENSKVVTVRCLNFWDEWATPRNGLISELCCVLSPVSSNEVLR